MIRSMQLRVNSRTEVYGKQYEGEQAPAPALAADTKAREQYAERKSALFAEAFPVPDDPELAQLLLEVRQIDKESRIECGRRYARMKLIVQHGRAGQNPISRHSWTWGGWCEFYVKERKRRDIYNCITEFEQSLLNIQKSDVGEEEPIAENVIPIRS